MRDPCILVEAVPASRKVLRKHFSFCRVSHVVEKLADLEALTMPLQGNNMHCEVTNVSPHSIRTFGKQPVGAWKKGDASTINVETTAGVTVEVPVFYAATSTFAHARESIEINTGKMFADLSSVCSQDNTFLRNLDTGELLLPLPWTVVSGRGKAGVRHVSRGRRKRFVELHDRRGRYQIVAVAVKRAVVRRSGVGEKKDGH
ncbi:hypothetical protein TraAM80_03609 [Trypanosoma rangeli]|uniref:Uncharacterized protein n=1 Tax=Trypanosoma rangeli TaxID=5698 RepID=A0A422NND2_TRYRA|nr:uncharacterized protein TraAM80_03609 [Trypanosoma rangeli]RNF06997.1 hypothetical protein TraAM80_03609 [Trypanosoma rangeli]|eukprot:RNF06997.1 hypothetical protein TraAM80_03609 [Trypanosoma rangeli]